MATNNIVIDSILDAEKKADQIIAKAKETSLKIVSDAEVEAEKIRNTAIENCKKLITVNLKLSEEENIKKYISSLEIYKEKAEEIVSLANKDIDKAVEYLIKRVK